MKRTFTFLFWIIIIQLQAQIQEDFNTSLYAKVTPEFPEGIENRYRCFNDCWGWTSPEGIEYAVLGTCWSIIIYSLEEPSDPLPIIEIPGAFSQWRDIKSFENYLYVVADEGTDGLLIIDLSNIDTIQWKFWNPEIITDIKTDNLNKCHNLYIDQGYAFLSGCNGLNNGGVLIIDLMSDPWNPTHISGAEDVYSHDVMTNGNFMYSSEVLDATLSIIDISDIQNPVTINRFNTGGRLTHNAWTSEDHQTIFVTHEESNGTVNAFDISDPLNQELLDQYQPIASLGRDLIPHNVHFINDFLVISYYTEGVKIVDAHRPNNLVEVGSLDTYTFRYDGYRGCWGAFPYFESGAILGSDRSTGLWIFQSDYTQAAYLEGIVFSADNGQLVKDVSVKIQNDAPNFTQSDALGNFKTGLGDAGEFRVDFTHPDYLALSKTYSFAAGEVITDSIVMEKATVITVSGNVMLENSGIQAQIVCWNEDERIVSSSLEDGSFSFQIKNKPYKMVVGSWGSLYFTSEINIEKDTNIGTISLNKGYQDHFISDYEWQIQKSKTTASSQAWAIDFHPEGSWYDDQYASPPIDVSGDVGEACMVTGPGKTLSKNLQDTSQLISPVIDASFYLQPVIIVEAWYKDLGVFEVEDILQFYLIQDNQKFLIHSFSEETKGWEPYSFTVSEFIDPSLPFQFLVMAADTGNPHIYEAAIDQFEIVESSTIAVDEQQIIKWSIFPNPANDFINIEVPEMVSSQLTLDLFDLTGKKIWSYPITQFTRLPMNNLASGIYILQLHSSALSTSKKLIKQ